MTDDDDTHPDLEAALDGLQDAELYCQSRGLTKTAYDIARLYQQVGRLAPEIEQDEIDDDALADLLAEDE